MASNSTRYQNLCFLFIHLSNSKQGRLHYIPYLRTVDLQFKSQLNISNLIFSRHILFNEPMSKFVLTVLM